MIARIRPRARLDLLEQFVYFGEHAGVELAERYFAAVDQTCRRLLKHPHTGVAYETGIARLAGMRRVRVKGFENYLLFYLHHEIGIDVIRVLHGARDIDSLFSQEEA